MNFKEKDETSCPHGDNLFRLTATGKSFIERPWRTKQNMLKVQHVKDSDKQKDKEKKL